MQRPAQPVPVTPFGDWCLLLLPFPSNGNRNSQTAPWLIPSLFSEDFPNTEGEEQGDETPEDDHHRESHYKVQNRSGDTFPQVCHVMNQNAQGLTGKDKLNEKIVLMITRGIHGYCLQERWLLGTFYRTIQGNLLLHHGTETKYCHRGWASRGFAIIIVPALLWA